MHACTCASNHAPAYPALRLHTQHTHVQDTHTHTPVGSVVRLLVPRRIPVRIEHNHSICSRERDAQRTRARTQEVCKDTALRPVEQCDLELSAREACAAVEAEIAALFHTHVVLDNVCVYACTQMYVCMVLHACMFASGNNGAVPCTCTSQYCLHVSMHVCTHVCTQNNGTVPSARSP
jgi:hypothetical protein